MRVLVVDDEMISRRTTARQLAAIGIMADAVDSAAAALQRLSESAWDVVLTDVQMPHMNGLELLGRIQTEHPGVDVIVMTAYGSVETAVAAMQQGAADYLTKPFPFAELHARLTKLREIRCVRRELAELRAAIHSDSETFGLVGRSPSMLRVYERIHLFAQHDAPILVIGETGTGKEVVARALHRHGPRASRPFVTVPCGAIPRELAESELFGHEKGSFTGAVKRRAGLFEQAHGGTLLLDDVDDLPLDLQVKLLRVLQEGRFTRVGGDSEVVVDVRVVATTKVTLRDAVASGKFREDVYYRLRGLELRLPPLRDRGDDALLLARYFLDKLAGQRGFEPMTLSAAAMGCLRRYSWPGNVRELRRTVEAAVVVCAAGDILPEHLPDDLQDAQQGNGDGLFSLHLGACHDVVFQDVVHHFEDALIDWAMAQAAGQQGKAAELLGLPRTTLQSKLARRPPI